MKKLFILQLTLIFLFCNKSFSQNWIDTWQNENNFYTIQKAFNKYNEKHEREEKRARRKKEEMGDDDEGAFSGYIQYKRWESFVEPRVYPSGDISLLTSISDNYQKFLVENNYSTTAANGKMSTTWTAMGPFGNLTGLATNGLPRKAGRINFVTLDPTNPNILWVGAPAGGLWKTTDGGTTWSTYNDNLAEIGCTDLAIDPTNPNIMYLATGDGYLTARNPGSIGIFKTTDGGITWSPTGLVFSSFPKIEVRHIIVNPVNPLIVLASTSNGIYRTTTGGVGAWSLVDGLTTYDLEFKTSNPDTVYASGKTFKRSTNAGLTFTTISSGIPTTGSQRMEIALTPANSNVVYVCSTTNTTYGLQGVYRSTNSGTTFTLMASTPDILASDCIVTTTSGQGWYDLAFDASPLNQNELVAGGLGAWKSLDGGATWAQIGCGYSLTATPPYVHTDHQEFEYSSTGVLYGVNDGGISKYTGTAWTDLSDPMNIAQIYKIGLSSLNPSLWITGHQDNGSNIHNSTTYKASLAADGTDNFIDRTNDLNMYASISAGSFYKSINGGTTWNTCTTGIGPASGFITPWKQDPVVATTLYAGRAQMYKSINSATSWTALGSMPGVTAGQFVTEFAVAPSNTQYIYAIHGTTGMFVSSNGGTSWTLSNTGISVASGALTFVTVDPTNEQVAYVTQSGFAAGKKVYKTTNAGTSWVNISYNLPNLPANCSVFETGNVNGRIYVGMDVGVYYIDNVTLAGGSPLWTLYNSGLPNTPVMDMEISPAAPTKITLATFGRGVYQADIVPSPFPPVTAFNYSGGTCTMPNTILFNDISTNSPTSWNWTVSPSTGVTITLPSSQNPTITFTNPGIYTVSLTASNGFGTGSLSTQSVAVGAPVIAVSASATTICPGQSTTLTASGGASYTWLPGGLSGSSVVVTPASSQTYTVVCTGANGCVANTTIGITVSICTGIIGNNDAIKFNVYPNPANDVLNINIGVDKTTDFEFEITNVFGQEVLRKGIKISPDKTEEQLNISSLANGIYFLKINSKEGNSQAIKIIKK